MLVKISNFGPISEFEFDIEKNLTMIVGRNNIGKSYALTLLYLILKRVLEIPPVPREMFEFDSGFRFLSIWEDDSGFKGADLIRKLVRNDSSSTSIEVTDIFKRGVMSFLSRTLARSLTGALQGTYGDLGNLVNRFSEKSPEIILRGEVITAKLQIKDEKIEVVSVELMHGRILLKESKQERSPRILSNGDYVCYYSKQNDDVLEKNYLSLLVELSFALSKDLGAHVSHVHYLPASRSGLYQALSAFGVIIAELSKSRSFLSKKIELPGISEPLSDYFIKLSEGKAISKRTAESKYSLFATKIEEEVLGGNIEIDSKSKKLIYRPQGTDLRLDLSSTSSMASEIGPIVTYLRHVLSEVDARRPKSKTKEVDAPKQIIFIEEPEAHLHPEVQVKLIEIIADLTKETNTRVIFTSHSNYIFNKISNMIIEKRIEITTFKAALFSLSDVGTTAVELDTDLFGIDDENFADISEKLYMERLDLLEEGNRKDVES